MPVVGFGARIVFRAREQEIEKIDAIIENHRDLYANRSQFVRAAVVRALREKHKVIVR